MNSIEELSCYLSDSSIESIRGLANMAEQPTLIICGKECKPARRVLNIGASYYYKSCPHLDWNDSTCFLKEFAPEANQCLINVYVNINSNIGWHCDKINNLKSSDVVSISLAKNQEDVGKTLAYMEFRQGTKGKSFLRIPLIHGTCVKFDAIRHSKENIYHRVAKTEFPRINLTFRDLSS